MGGRQKIGLFASLQEACTGMLDYSARETCALAHEAATLFLGEFTIQYQYRYRTGTNSR